MAGQPSVVVALAGTVRSIERFDTRPDVKTGEVRQAARVTLLTEPDGGFGEVYVSPDDLVGLGVIEQGSAVHWRATASAGHRKQADGTRSTFATLWLRFASLVEADDTRVSSKHLSATA